MELTFGLLKAENPKVRRVSELLMVVAYLVL
jgi:hypothetical protein